MTNVDMTPYSWARTEDVLVTLVRRDVDDTDSTWLIQRTEHLFHQPRENAFVVRFEAERVTVNGLNLPIEAERGEWADVLCTLADALALAPSPVVGQSVTTRYEV